jgi:Flp pilus assembly protein TadB
MQNFFSYPEFLLAGILLIVVLASSRQDMDMHFPAWLADPAKLCLTWTPVSYQQWVNKLLIQANWRSITSLGDFASTKLCLSLFSLTTLYFLSPYLVGVLSFICWFLSDLFLIFTVSQRKKRIFTSLPQALDLMVLCVDAGLGLEATLQRIAKESSGIGNELNEELNILGREVLLGIDRERAYQELYRRTGVDELKTFGSALGQANKLGLSIAKIIRAQSEFIRKKQSQKAEEQAMKMPIYMAFPLWFFIMPSLMLLVLAPSLIKFYHQMHGGGL